MSVENEENKDLEFEKVASALNKVYKAVSKLFRGYTQQNMIQVVFCGLLTGQPVLIIGEHASMKSSLSDFVGKKLFDKPVVRLSETFSSPDELRAWIEKTAKTLNIDPDLFERNLVDGIVIEYSEFGGKVRCKVAIDVVKHPEANKLGEVKREPIWYYSKQVTDQDAPEDILGYTVTHPALLSMRPPYMVKEGRLAGADYIFLDELFASPILVAHLHRALNEKVVDTELGQAEFQPLGLIAATNPFNSNYATNPKVINFATLDRYAFSAETTAASTAEILTTIEELKNKEVSTRLPVELIYAARKLLDKVTIPDKLLHFAVVLVAHLSRCYFTTSKSEKRMEAVSPFLLEGRDCQSCIYAGYPCSIANITRTRAIINIEKGMRALALLKGRNEATDEDLIDVLMMVLPHRALWNNQEFVTFAGSPFNATKQLIKYFAEEVAKRKDRFEQVLQLYNTPNPKLADELKRKFTDDPLIRSFIDEIVDQMKEVARKKSDKKTLEFLTEQINLKDALDVLK